MGQLFPGAGKPLRKAFPRFGGVDAYGKGQETNKKDVARALGRRKRLQAASFHAGRREIFLERLSAFPEGVRRASKKVI